VAAVADAAGGSGAMFDRIADRYDLLNRLASLGHDQRWRGRAVDALELAAGQRILDLATGTGDLALQILQRGPRCAVVGLDPSARMLDVARRKLAAAHVGDRAELRVGDAQALPFSDQSFDAVTMAFGIRNVADRGRALREMARVTRDGGPVVILELSNPGPGLLGRLARLHVHRVIPWLGARLSGAREYAYLSESIAAFPPADAFAELMVSSGLDVRSVARLTLGVAVCYVGRPRRAA
jgi:demethylmenaquinone methyltransferase / 2-methoxy-6-polyprenyl-1,4-benzoquinol methylase